MSNKVPVILNIFIKKLLLLIRHANIAKFVYSNTLCIASKDNQSLLGILIKDSGSEVQWFKYNKIFAFPDKFRT